MTQGQSFFLDLVRLGIGEITPDHVHWGGQIRWSAIQALAVNQGLLAVVLDGLEKMPFDYKPQKIELLQWIGEVVQNEAVQREQQNTSEQIAELFHQNRIRTYVLKGAAVAECYPKPSQRWSADFDCFLLAENGGTDVWELGNQLIEKAGFQVDRNFYKNSTFHLPNLTVENHHFMVPFRGNERLRRLEVMLQGILKSDKEDDRFGDTWLYRPPVMVTTLFLIEHAYSHFLHEGLTWKMVLDWMLFSRKHKREIDWYALDTLIDEFGFRRFYDSYNRLGQYLLGDIDDAGLSDLDKRMLKDVWSDLTLPASGCGLKNKLSLVRNTLKANWKYRHFAEISMLKSLFIQINGFFFIKNPTLN